MDQRFLKRVVSKLMTTKNRDSNKKINWIFYISFVVATISITKFFTSHRYFSQGNEFMGYSVVVISLTAFMVSLFFLAFEIYADEKKNNNLRVSFAPFEAMYKRFKLKAN